MAGTQFFDIDPIPVCYGYIKLIVLETFGDQKCYMNQVFLLAENPQAEDAQVEEPFGDLVGKTQSFIESPGRSSHGSRGIKTPPARGTLAGEAARTRNFPKMIDGSAKKSVDNEFQDHVLHEIRLIREELEDQRGRNRVLQAKVDNLEDQVDQKQSMIDQLGGLISTITQQLSANKQQFAQEKAQLKMDMTKLMNARFEEISRDLSRSAAITRTDPMKDIQKEFSLAGHSSHQYSGAKDKNSDSSLRHRQQGLADLIGQLKEAIELRVGRRLPQEIKLNQLKSIPDNDYIDLQQGKAALF